MTKSLPISKRMVYNSYLKVCANGGSAGIDQQSIELFNAHMADNLYKLWNRMTSGCYFPPAVREVLIPKKQGGVRPLGIPTVSDRIAQGVVKDYLEPGLEAIFHPSSFGYRPGRSAHDALQRCQQNCNMFGWVVDVDIKGFFDNLSHELMMELLQRHTQEKWVLMYVERWLKAGVEAPDGSKRERLKGTPQGGVISPLLANVYLHHAFDMWMECQEDGCPFERYADDIVIHCATQQQAEAVLEKLKIRLKQYSLEVNEEKTKIVYCKSDRHRGGHNHESFTFLSYSFQPRYIKAKTGRGKGRLAFSAAICGRAKTAIREGIRQVLKPQWSGRPLEWFASVLNPKIRGWVNYYTKYNRYEALSVFYYLNERIRKWIRHTFKIKGKRAWKRKYQQVQKAEPLMFYHWKLGIIQ
jgi:group II intron reverse transcriptase/maturase